MRILATYILIVSFFIGVLQPITYLFFDKSDSSLIFSLNNIPDTNGESEDGNPKDSSEDFNGLDDFFYHHSLLSFLDYSSFLKNSYNLFSERNLLSGFTNIIIPPPRF